MGLDLTVPNPNYKSKEQSMNVPRTLVYLGGNVGLGLQGLINKYVFDKILVVEAHPVTFRHLEKRFRFHKNVTCINACLAPVADKNLRDFFATANSVSSSMLQPPTQNHFGGTREILRLPTVTLREVLTANGIHQIDFYVSDLQGVDFEILSSISDYIQSRRIKELFIETHLKPSVYLNARNGMKDFWDLLCANYKLNYMSFDGAIATDYHGIVGGSLGILANECDAHWGLIENKKIDYLWR